MVRKQKPNWLYHDKALVSMELVNPSLIGYRVQPFLPCPLRAVLRAVGAWETLYSPSNFGGSHISEPFLSTFCRQLGVWSEGETNHNACYVFIVLL